MDRTVSNTHGVGQAAPTSTHDILESIQVMRVQEEMKYKTEDYFVPDYYYADEDEVMQVESFTPGEAQETPIDAQCRFRMSEWCYHIVDFCNFKRETVAIAMSNLDRYLGSAGGREIYLARKKFQLASMVSLYNSVKVHEQEALDPQLIAKLSGGAFEPDEIEEMEAVMLTAIDFRVNPPTALAFANLFLTMVPENLIDVAARDTIMELTKFQTEIAVSDVDLMCINSSSIALSALMNSFDSLNMDSRLQAFILDGLSQATQIDCQEPLFLDLRIRLYETLTGQANNEYCSSISPQAAAPGGFSKTNTTTFYESPRSVAS